RTCYTSLRVPDLQSRERPALRCPSTVRKEPPMARTGCALASLLLALLPLPASAQWRVGPPPPGRPPAVGAPDPPPPPPPARPVPRAPAARLTTPLPELVRPGACAPGRNTLAVSTHSGVFRLWLADGRVEEVVPGAAGLLAFDAAGKRLGVLGSIPEPGTRPA